MNIAVDIGNSYIKFGCFENGKLKKSLVYKSIDEAKDFLKKEAPQSIIISSVGKGPGEFAKGLDDIAHVLIMSSELQVPIKNKYNYPNTLGQDRLAAAVGANFIFPNKNCLSVDIGTCITFDFLNDQGEYLGGSISPGLSMKLKALHTFTSRLPLIEAIGDAGLIGKTTEESILSGVINGTSAEIETMIQFYNNKFENLQVIICGGDAKFFETRIKATIFVIPELVLIGLNRILEHNV
ncbi:MAG: type III pantothenate kinase [Bacteroidota bacterium]|nr:type III pantothenate kinase [Bacteroidota bacterium]